MPRGRRPRGSPESRSTHRRLRGRCAGRARRAGCRYGPGAAGAHSSGRPRPAARPGAARAVRAGAGRTVVRPGGGQPGSTPVRCTGGRGPDAVPAVPGAAPGGLPGTPPGMPLAVLPVAVVAVPLVVRVAGTGPGGCPAPDVIRHAHVRPSSTGARSAPPARHRATPAAHTCRPTAPDRPRTLSTGIGRYASSGAEGRRRERRRCRSPGRDGRRDRRRGAVRAGGGHPRGHRGEGGAARPQALVACGFSRARSPVRT